MDNAEFERLLFAYRDACEYGGPRSDKAKRIFAALLDYVAREPELVGYVNYYEKWCGYVHQTEDDARSYANEQASEVAVPVYRFPAPVTPGESEREGNDD